VLTGARLAAAQKVEGVPKPPNETPRVPARIHSRLGTRTKAVCRPFPVSLAPSSMLALGPCSSRIGQSTQKPPLGWLPRSFDEIEIDSRIGRAEAVRGPGCYYQRATRLDPTDPQTWIN
jgi:hypothetical protein